jgi:SOUL heme-binding protein
LFAQIDPLLTPTGKKLQDGTRAVARQLANDILPSLTRPIAAAAASSSPSSPTSFLPPLSLLPNPQDVSRVGNRLLNTISNQLQRNLETLQSDLANPSRIPERLAKQTEDFLQEASNVFSEKPAGLKEPAYTVVAQCADYEIRDYAAYTVATTNMPSTASTSIRSRTNDNPAALADQGVAFNTLASYIFGSNAENRAMEMTTPVTTTATGEMRFYLPDDDNVSPPQPLAQDAAARNSGMEYYTAAEPSKIRLERIPAARLAVRRFTGFCTAGEIARQKQALLAALALDSNLVELDVPHGQTVGHVVFQYNPPYTLPVLRLNEIAVPVLVVGSEEDDEPLDAVDRTWEAGIANGVTA